MNKLFRYLSMGVFALIMTFGLNFNVSAQMCNAPASADWISLMSDQTNNSVGVTSIAIHPVADYVAVGGGYSGFGLGGTSLPPSQGFTQDPFLSLLYKPNGIDALDVPLLGSGRESLIDMAYLNNGEFVYATSYTNTSTNYQVNVMSGFLPGQLPDIITATGSGIAISRVSAGFNYLGSHRIESVVPFLNVINVNEMHLAPSGDVFVTGRFNGIIDFDASGAGDVRTNVSAQDLFVTKINANGTYAWTQTASWTAGAAGFRSIEGLALATDGLGNLIVGGKTSSNSSSLAVIDFGSGITISPAAATGQDGFLLSLNGTTGAPQIAWTVGGAGLDSVEGIAIDSNGTDMYVVGLFSQTGAEFSATNIGVPSFTQSTLSSNSLFVIKYASLVPTWFAQEGSLSSSFQTLRDFEVRVNGCNQVLALGTFNGTGFTTLGNATGFTDGFLLKYDAMTGANLWSLPLTAGPNSQIVMKDFGFIGNGTIVATGTGSIQSAVANVLPSVTFRISDNVNPTVPGCDCI